MEDPKWLKLVTIGLVLAALAVGYFLLNGKFYSNKQKTNTQISQTVVTPSPIATAKSSPAIVAQNKSVTAVASVSPSASPLSAYNRIVNRTQTNNQTTQALPNTGFPVGVALALSISTIITGWGLHKFPR